jgi:vacuolar protein sorting-associated protein 26
MTYNFSFKKVNLPYESYEGNIVSVKYFIKVTITKKIFSTKLTVEKNFKVQNVKPAPELNPNIRMEVGISNLIHFEYELYQSKFSLEECIIGKIFFIQVAMKVRALEIHLIKRETIGQKSDTALLSKFEVIDGNPAAEEIVPIRMFINSFELSPTYKDINNIVSVKYFIKFVVIDESEKSFFKQQEIILWRSSIN